MDRYTYVKGKRVDLLKLHRTSILWYPSENLATLIVNYRKLATFKSIDTAYNIATELEKQAREYQFQHEITKSSIEK